jgi:DNA 3'-phosphatase
LLKVAAGWDDHDAAVDNANKNTKGISEALRAAQAVYGSPDIPGVVENGKEGFYKLITLRGQNFLILDNRTFRDEPGNTRYGHFGEAQETWMINKVKDLPGPKHLMSGDMWFSPTIISDSGKRMTESLYGDHPVNAEALMKSLEATKANYLFYSGDIHFSQVIGHGPDFIGTPRYSSFETLEITSSPAHSIIFRPKPGEAQFWSDPARIIGVKDYNFVVVTSKVVENGGVDVQAKSMGIAGTPFFSYGAQINRNPVYVSPRRQIRDNGFRIVNDADKRLVRVAFFDADDTLRIAPSKSISASGPTDVAILPGVAEKLKALTEQGYLIAIVSNQGGVAAGKVKFEVADQALQYTIRQIEAAAPGAKIHYYDMGERGHEDYYSKPNVGMAKHLEGVLSRRGLQLDWSSSFMVGDAQYTKVQVRPNGEVGYDFSDGDRRFAENLGIRSYHPRDFFSWSASERSAIAARDVPAFQRNSKVGLCKQALVAGH